MHFDLRRLLGSCLGAVVFVVAACGGGAEQRATNSQVLMLSPPAGVDPETGIWWNPAESGRGYAIDTQNGIVSLGAYMYDDAGRPVWYLAALNRQIDGTFAGPMTRYLGGQTLGGAYRPPTSTSVIATLTLQAHTAKTATLRIQMSDASAVTVVPIQRFGGSQVLPSQASFQNGLWWDESQRGSGYFVDVQGLQAAIGSYMYDETGRPTWYLTSAAMTSAIDAQGAMDTFTGGQTLTGPYRAPARGASSGQMRFTAQSDTTARLTLPNGTVVSLTRFLFGDGPAQGSATVSVFAGFRQSVGSAAAVGAGSVDAQGEFARFNYPQGLAVLADGALLVGDERNDVVRHVSPSGFVSTLPARFAVFKRGDGFSSSPSSYVAVDDQGTSYVTGSNALGTNAVYAVAPSGQVRFHAKFQQVTTSLAAGPGGVLYVGTQGSIEVLNADGSSNRTISGTSCSESAIAAKGLVLYLACPGAHTVRLINAQGVSSIFAGQQSNPGNLDGVGTQSLLESPSAVAVDPAGNLYIADASTIRRMTPDGTVRTIASFTSVPYYVKALAWSGGSLYATVPHAVLKIGPLN